MTDRHHPHVHQTQTDVAGHVREDQPARVVLVTGLSGAGKTSALKALEDLGYEAVDNLPISLLHGLVHPPQATLPGLPERPIAIGIDIRTRDFGVDLLLSELDALERSGRRETSLLFLDCDDDELARRYAETRHRHPLAQDRPVRDGIRHEREVLSPLRERSDMIIDTTGTGPGELKSLLATAFRREAESALIVFVTSFGFKRGLPRQADLVFDVRFLDNPHYDPILKPLTGQDAAVGKRILEDEGFEPFFTSLTGLLHPLLPRYQAEGKSYLTIAIGCTGGRHRSVYTAERLAEWLREQGELVRLEHRDLDRD